MQQASPILSLEVECSAMTLHSLGTRSRGLFNLLAATCGGSSRHASRAIGRDLRAMRGEQETPTLGHIVELGRALGLAPRDALAVIAHRASTRASHSALLEAIALADLRDDATELEHLADGLATSAHGTPSHQQVFALSLLVSARAAVSRGEVREAISFARRAERVGLNRSHPLTLQLMDVIDGEAMLGTPWLGGHALSQPRLDVARGNGFASRSCSPKDPDDLVTLRSRCFASAERILTSCPPRVNQIDAVLVLAELNALRTALDIGAVVRQRADGAAAQLWIASIAGHTAHRVLERAAPDARIEVAAFSLAAQASLALEDELENAATHDKCLACARRARLVLSEWASRSARDELTSGAFDELDRAEFDAACVRFPRARSVGCFDALAAGAVASNFKSTKLVLDMSSGGCPMQSQTKRSQSRVADANPSSEEQC